MPRDSSQQSIPNTPYRPDPPRPSQLLAAGRALLPLLEQGAALTAQSMRATMTQAFAASDTEGAWTWKDAAEAAEIAQILFMQRHAAAMGLARPDGDPRTILGMLRKIATLVPTQTKRSLESATLQQFSTPLPLAYCVCLAARITASDRVLEPSAGTGMLAVFGDAARASLLLNEISEVRAGVLAGLFPAAQRYSVDGATLHDRLPAAHIPTIVLMNPPFSAALNITRTQRGEDERQLAASLARLADNGRLVAILSSSAALESLPPDVTLRLRVQLGGALFAAHCALRSMATS